MNITRAAWYGIMVMTVVSWVLLITIAIVGVKTLGWPAIAAGFVTIALWCGKIIWEEVLVEELHKS